MDALLDKARTIYEGEIDFQGQKVAEMITYALLTISGVVAFFAGFATQNIYQTLYTGLAGTALTFLVVVPPWPFFNQNPLPWLPARTARVGGGHGVSGLEGISIEVDGKKVS